MKRLEAYSAYHGRGWQARRARLADELKAGGPWSPLRVDSEYRDLKAVLLYVPGRELSRVREPNAVQHLERLSPVRVARELRGLAALYRRLGIAVHFIDGKAFKGQAPGANLMYARDLFFNTRAGAVVARMGSRVRAGEEKFAALALAQAAVPIARTVGGQATFEGADALWLDSGTVLLGQGARTNRAAAAELKATLAAQGARVVCVGLPRGVQHLLGLAQLVDRDLALVRTELAPAALTRLLKKKGVKVVSVPESDEVRQRQGMNVVTVRPRTIVMPAGCPRLRALYLKAGLRIAGEARIDELLKGAGGLACATGILARKVGP